MSEPTRSRPPVPVSVSEEAQAFLKIAPYPARPKPALDDIDGWVRRVEEVNRQIAARYARTPCPVDTEASDIGGVTTYIACAPGVRNDNTTPIYIDFHGGGLMNGGGPLCGHLAGVKAMDTDMIMWAPDYRMPPHNPYPAALDDCIAVYRAVLDRRSPKEIFVGGGSAGGNLAAALLVRAKDEGLPMPAGLLLLSPEVDLTESGDTFNTLLGIDNVLTGSLAISIQLYANGYDLAHPYLSPLLADLRGFPDTFLQSGTRDLFLSNTVRMHRKLLAADVEAELHIFEAMPHGGFGGGAPEDREVRRAVRRFLDRHRRHPIVG